MKKLMIVPVLVLILLLALACAPAPTPAPTPVPPSATVVPAPATPVPPSATPVPPTATRVPPTATATLPPPTAAATLPPPTATPLPPATSTPATDTSVVFTDDYGTSCKLLQSDSTERKLGCANGEYVMLNKTVNTMWYVYYGDPYDNSVIEADARVDGGGKSLAYGIVFRVSSDGKSFYRFVVTTNGYYGVHYYANGIWIDLLEYAPSSAIKQGNATNRLKIIAQGDQLAFYANDQYLDRTALSELDSGAVGFTIDNSDANGQVAFDNLSIAKINRELVLPPPVAAGAPTEAPSAPQGPSCADTPAGMAGLLWINAFDGEATVTIVDHEYHIPGKTTLLIPIPPDKKFVIDAFIPGVGRLRPAPGPFTWAAGYCEVWSPGREQQ